VIHLADFFPVILVSLCAAVVFSPLMIRSAVKLGLVDVPGSQAHKWHSQSTPVACGAAIAFALAATYLFLRPSLEGRVGVILLAGAVAFLWGLWDDRRPLPAWLKLVGQILGALILWFGGVGASLVESNWVNLAITLVWTVGMVNACNFIDGLDGLLLGLTAVASAFFMLVTADSGQTALTALSAAVLGATIGAFYFNAPPARAFNGDSGAQLLGMLLAGIGVAYNPVGLPNAVSWFVPILVLAVPVFNLVLVVASRLVRRRRLFQAYMDHVSHRLVWMGLDRTRTVLALQLVAIALGLVAFIALGGTPFSANLLFGVIVLVGIAGVVFLEKNFPPDEGIPKPQSTSPEAEDPE
jgi:UDP-GlcNAc:undecaprenyl-phosphate GlcNAc-1-phosphate transferase